MAVRASLRVQSDIAGLAQVAQTKLITAGSELARNILKYAGEQGGQMSISLVWAGERRGVRAIFSDQGPGIPDIAAAMKDGYSTGGSLGLGLPGARRLVDEFSLESAPGKGTVITITQWRR